MSSTEELTPGRLTFIARNYEDVQSLRSKSVRRNRFENWISVTQRDERLRLDWGDLVGAHLNSSQYSTNGEFARVDRRTDRVKRQNQGRGLYRRTDAMRVRSSCHRRHIWMSNWL